MKATKPDEKGGRKLERQIVLMKQGNLSRSTLWREGGAIVKESLEGKMQSTPRPESVLTKLQRVAEISGKAPGMV